MSMFKKRSKSSVAPSRSTLLSSIPIKNALVREKQMNKKNLRLTAPLKPSRLHAFISKSPTEKSFDLDDLGQDVWSRLDHQQTIEHLIQSFAEDHHLNLREAEVSILLFLNTLAKRNLIALLTPKQS